MVGRRLLFIVFIFFLPLVFSAFALDRSISIATNDSTTGESPALQIIDHSMASQVNEETAEIIARNSTFSNTTDKVYSWLELGKIDAVHQVEWKWIAPDGSLYDTYADQISKPEGEPWDWYDIYAYIPIAGEDAAKMPGKWQVEVYLDGQKRLTEQFTIATNNSTTGGSPALQIIDHSMASQVNEETAEIITRNSTFSNTTDKVYSWLELGKIDAAHQVEWKWIAPDGSLYDSYTDQISKQEGELWDWYDFYAYISIAGEDAAKMPGKWQVEVYLDGQKRLTEQFTIIGQKTSSQSFPISPGTNPSAPQTNSSQLPNPSVPKANITPQATEPYTREITGYVKYLGGNVVRMGVDVKLQEMYNGNVFDIASAVSSRQNGSFKIIYSSDKLQNPDKPHLIIQAFSGGKPFSNPMEIVGGTNEVIELICSP